MCFYTLTMRSVLWGLSVFALVGCSTADPATASTTAPAGADVASAPSASEASRVASVENEGVAYFAGGCFWGVEYFLEKMDGVLVVESGYMGGEERNPTYEQVSAHQTKHLETVRVRYDADKTDFRAIAKRFFEIHDPTQADGQGPDIGEQYLSAVFYADDQQKKDTEELIGLLRTNGYDVVTKVLPADKDFWAAEDYHQDYYDNNGKQPYCHVPIKRFDSPGE